MHLHESTHNTMDSASSSEDLRVTELILNSLTVGHLKEWLHGQIHNNQPTDWEEFIKDIRERVLPQMKKGNVYNKLMSEHKIDNTVFPNNKLGTSHLRYDATEISKIMETVTTAAQQVVTKDPMQKAALRELVTPAAADDTSS